MRGMRRIVCLLFLLAAGRAFPALAQDEPVVRSLLFHSPNCGHCSLVMEETLPPLQETFGERLDILMVDTATPSGQELYQSMVDTFQPASERRGVPSLVVGEQLLVGSREVPDQFPGIIEAGLAAGGIDWPNIPGLESYLADLGREMETNLGQETETAADDFSGFQSGMAIAWLVLAGLVITLAICGYRVWQYRGAWTKAGAPGAAGRNWGIVILGIVGLAIAGYLAYVEVVDTPAVCGPVGDCNTVQSSQYVHLLLLPMGVWGAIAYALTLGLVGLGVFGPERAARYARPALLGLSLFCVVFSIFLTYLEIFVIQATCSWCMGSAVTVAAICWLVTRDAAWLPTTPSRKLIKRRRRAKA